MELLIEGVEWWGNISRNDEESGDKRPAFFLQFGRHDNSKTLIAIKLKTNGGFHQNDINKIFHTPTYYSLNMSYIKYL